MNRLLVTGLATGIGAGVCQVCNYDLEWLLNYPSLLLWADKLLVFDSIWKIIQEEKYPKPTEVAKCCKLIFDIANAEGLIEVKDSSPIVDGILRDDIFSQISLDIGEMKRLFPDKISLRSLSKKKGDKSLNETIINGHSYCPPYLWSVYSNLILSRLYGANCLFDDTALNYLRFKFGIIHFPTEADPAKPKSFVNVFKSYLPNDPLIPTFALHSQGNCKKCAHHQRCNDSYLQDLEKKVSELLKWREYDEFQQAKGVFDEIIAQHKSKGVPIIPEDVGKSFEKIQTKLGKRVHNLFPKVRRWSSVAAVLSIPATIVSVALGDSLVSISSASLFGLSQIGKECVEALESKYRWLGFLQSMKK